MVNEDRRQANKVKYVLWRHLATEYKGKVIPFQAYCRPREFQEVESSRFQDTRHMKTVKVSVLRTGRLYPPGNIPGTHFVRGCVDPRATVLPEVLRQWNIPMTPSGIDPATFDSAPPRGPFKVPWSNLRTSNLISIKRICNFFYTVWRLGTREKWKRI